MPLLSRDSGPFRYAAVRNFFRVGTSAGSGANIDPTARRSLFDARVSRAIVKKMTWLDGLAQFLRWLIRPERRIEPKTERSEEAPGDAVAYRLALDEAIRALEGPAREPR
jgi:hypothetical protein